MSATPNVKYAYNRAEIFAELAYDPDTDLFTWTKPRRGRHPDRPVCHLDKDGYRVLYIEDRAYFAHRLAWYHVHDVWPDGRLDHRNGKRDDNCISNLRPATASQNAANRLPGPPSRSGYRGVRKATKGPNWQAIVKHEGREVWIGVFATPLDAARSYDERAIELHGEFAVLDFPRASRKRSAAGIVAEGKLARDFYRKRDAERARKPSLPSPLVSSPAEAA